MKKNLKLLCVLCAALVVLFTGWILCDKVFHVFDSEPTKEPDPLETREDEEERYNTLFIYPQVDDALVSKISVKNEHGTYAFVRKSGIKRSGTETTVFSEDFYKKLIAAVNQAIGNVLSPVCRATTVSELQPYGLTEKTSAATFTFVAGSSQYAVRVGQADGKWYFCASGDANVFELGAIENATVSSIDDDMINEIMRLGLGGSNISGIGVYVGTATTLTYSYVKSSATVIDGYDDLYYDQKKYAYLKSYVTSPSTLDMTPIVRDATAADLEKYHVTPATCQASYTLELTDGRTYEVCIGRAAFSDTDSYYVARTDGKTIYRFLGSISIGSDYSTTMEAIFFTPVEEYVSPMLIGVPSAACAYMPVRFSVTHFDGTSEKPVFAMQRSEETLTSDSYITFVSNYPVRLAMDTSYVTTAWQALFVTTYDDEAIVAINPDDATLAQYGLGAGMPYYDIYTGCSAMFGATEFTFRVSERMDDGYFYVITPAYNIGTRNYTETGVNGTTVTKTVYSIVPTYTETVAVMRLSPSRLAGITDEFNVDDCFGFHSENAYSGFYAYLEAYESMYQPGVKTVRVSVPSLDNFSETFHPVFTQVTDTKTSLTVTAVNSKKVWTDSTNPNDTGYRKNNFRNLYSFFSMKTRFTGWMNDTAFAVATAKEENLIIDLTFELNNGRVERYEIFRSTTYGRSVIRQTVNDEPAQYFFGNTEDAESMCRAVRMLMNDELIDCNNSHI